MDNKLPTDLVQAAWSFVATWGLAGLGRLLFHVQEVGKGRRRFVSLHLLWETMTALSIGFVAEGVCAYFELRGSVATAVIIVVSYLGPRFIEKISMKLLDRVGN